MSTGAIVVAVVSEKGGAGKTTIALDLAVNAVSKGYKVAVIDVDPQSTSSNWTDRRSHEYPWVVATHASRIVATIEQAKTKGIDFIVIDTPPHSATEATEAARRADVVVLPVARPQLCPGLSHRKLFSHRELRLLVHPRRQIAA